MTFGSNPDPFCTIHSFLKLPNIYQCPLYVSPVLGAVGMRWQADLIPGLQQFIIQSLELATHWSHLGSFYNNKYLTTLCLLAPSPPQRIKFNLLGIGPSLQQFFFPSSSSF